VEGNDFSVNSTLDSVLSSVLRFGLTIALLITLAGGTIVLWQHGMDTVDYSVFNGESSSLTHIQAILSGAYHGNTKAIIQLGILFMILTPIARVLSCTIVFSFQRDIIYIVLSVFVLAVLLFSLTL